MSNFREFLTCHMEVVHPKFKVDISVVCVHSVFKMGVVNLVEHLNDKALMGRHLYSMMMLLDETKMALGNQTGASGTGTSKTQLSAFLDRLIQLESKTERVNRELVGSCGVTH